MRTPMGEDSLDGFLGSGAAWQHGEVDGFGQDGVSTFRGK